MDVLTSVVLWLLDVGSEAFLAVSLGSLRLNAAATWRNTVKVVIDCGLSNEMRSFLHSAAADQVRVFPLDFLESSLDITGHGRGIVPMQARMRAPHLLSRLERRGDLPSFDACLVCDTDTVFLRDFSCPRPPRDTDVLIMQEWDVRDGVEQPLVLLRQSTFRRPLTQVPVSMLTTALGIPSNTLATLPTYNTGVLAFGSEGSRFVDAWLAEYDRLIGVTDEAGDPIVAPYSAEQNALSIAIHRQTVTWMPLPRQFNQFPPRRPAQWPQDTVIAHFITFPRNHQEPRYRLWFQARNMVRDAGWIPPSLLPDIEVNRET